ncbi:hypothetical protein PR048_032699 [Dryococelus australis]|uniref:RNA-directed DNA polymerase n=1 Tax=Dryococelus australis TaxID=614101 RepID=A0ABQ9G3P8_9NEOP|nr:hypothetical protein PR048_032699 [Dryococelus australis]
MLFRIASAPEVFQQIMCHTLHGIKGANCSMDDILLHAESINKLDAITEMKFLGHVLSDKGIQPDPENIEAIERLKKPQSITELQRFMGMINYLSKFIPRVAERSALLRKLLEKDVAWHWELEHENAFEDLKVCLKSLPLPRYFNHTKPVTISVDASSYSVASVLQQENHPVFYASKAFTMTQQNYNTLSRDCHDIPEPDTRAVYEVHVVIPMSAQRMAQLKDAIHTSTKLSGLCWFILQGWPDTIQQVPDNLRKYWSFRDELAVYEDIIFKGKRTLIPPSWKPLILSQLHCSHKGFQGTVAIARYQVFWSSMRQDIIRIVQKCATCQKFQNNPSQDSLSEETVPSRP